MNYFRFVARECREIMAAMGVRTLAELIGHTELLEILPGETSKQRKLDLQPVLANSKLVSNKPQYCVNPRNEPFDKGVLGEAMLRDMRAAIDAKSGGEFSYEVRNYHRSIGARISGEIAKLWGNKGMSDAPLIVNLKGSAGQSFGVWNAGGLHLHLEGEANDYVGKGMAAGKIVLKPHARSTFVARETVIMGNTCLYGATGGELYAAGTAGERFAVRNSGALAVVEGAGDHCCEYMTGGVVCVLGPHGRELRRGLHRRLCLRARHGARFRRSLQPRADRYPPRLAGRHGYARAASARADRAACAGHRQRVGRAAAERLPHLYRKILGGEAEGGRHRFLARQSAPRRVSGRARPTHYGR